MSLLVKTIKKLNFEKTPIWLMRQAGRYLPEYNKIRSKAGSFLDLCNNSDLSAEITLQPLKRFDLDAAIIFSDILTIPQALGAEVSFIENIGPIIKFDYMEEKIEGLFDHIDQTNLSPTYDTIKKVREKLAKEKALIGFTGAPWTLAAYMVEGKSSKDFNKVRNFSYKEPKKFNLLIKNIEKTVVHHLKNQISSGADVVQIFDSHAGFAEHELFKKFCIDPVRRIVNEVKSFSPNTPIICFPRGAGAKYLDFVKHVDLDVISVDYTVDPLWALKNLQKHAIIQGNLDPVILQAGGAEMNTTVNALLKIFNKKPHIFNLGHGILPDTPLKNVKELINLVHAVKT